MAIPYRIDPPIFADYFQYRIPSQIPSSTSIPDHWTIESGEFTTRFHRDLKVLSPGEMVYNGDPLNDLVTVGEYGDFSIIVNFWGQEDLQFEIRARRTENHYVAFGVDFTNNKVYSVGTDGLDQIDVAHVMKYDGRYFYVAELMCFEDHIYCFLNGSMLAHREFNVNTTVDGFSLYVPTVSSVSSFMSIGAHQLTTPPARALENDPSNLMVLFRKLMKEEIENPETETWESFVRAETLYSNHSNLWYINQTWEELGYPIQKPSTEDWFIT